MILALFLIAIGLGIDWGITCGILWLAAWCFGLVFDLKIATGAWLMIFLVRTIFKSYTHKD